ncbi:Bacillosamine/Legionaminic acid biosynthesis aminotransferase PglE; 4-keto-6-deoxy-N-Acetyl-D-hexosaminyl-(Lipid carrier) aminotransferase [Olavius algarvensis Delta 1 endosymbiont]|nr:Bacillosamine/Legionaminic acid biosynthesis aminotransferase PglE; 4-keto-6-deoxy-N-Acetyl-D-hexosaminyl-(Lipid carrier) aminotransferase [Olavius algarvensis Delta 1 endosymbiont]
MIPYGKQDIAAEEIDAVVEILKAERLTQGPVISQFEEAVAAYCGARHAIAVSNGTAALHVAAMAIDIKSGDEGITSPNTFLASANCLLFCRAIPRFADIDPVTNCIDPDKIKKSITPRTRVIIPIDFAGHPCEMETIWELALENNLSVIEDAAHAIGTSWADHQGDWHKAGACSHSHLTIFSFHPVKTITAGEGGMILTNDPGLAAKCRLLRNHGITRKPTKFTHQNSAIFDKQFPPPWYYEMHTLGYNYRITDFQCALGLAQMERLDQFVTRRREIWTQYSSALEGIEGFQIPVEREATRSAWHLYAAQADERDELLKFLHEKGIGAHAMYIPIHLQPYYQKHFSYEVGDFPYAEAYFKKSIILPLYPSLTDAQAEYITNQVKTYYQN